MTLAATLSAETAREQAWEFVVIGAGPAGSFAALRLAQAGRRVLLVEKKSFPREKVCGGCIGADAVALLQAAGLERELNALPQQVADRLKLHAGGRSADVRVRPIRVISRADLDACLVRAAVAAGASFLPETSALAESVVGERRTIECRQSQSGKFTVTAEFVIVADGLAHSSLQRIESVRDHVSPRSHLGLGTVLSEDVTWCATHGLARGEVQMVLGRRGYVGLARSHRGQLHVAAAVHPAALAERKSPPLMIAELLREAGKPVWADRAREHWSEATWCGTPPLTHCLSRMSADRLFVLGDAATYVEPFTGEGIFWALLAAEKLTSLLTQGRSRSSSQFARDWQRLTQGPLRRQSRICRCLSALLRFPTAASYAVSAFAAWPASAAFLVQRLNRPSNAFGHLS